MVVRLELGSGGEHANWPCYRRACEREWTARLGRVNCEDLIWINMV